MKNTQDINAEAFRSSAWLDDMDADKARTAKWLWKMNYCKKHGLAPAQNGMWDIAETKWQEAQSPNARTERQPPGCAHDGTKDV